MVQGGIVSTPIVHEMRLHLWDGLHHVWVLRLGLHFSHLGTSNPGKLRLGSHHHEVFGFAFPKVDTPPQ